MPADEEWTELRGANNCIWTGDFEKSGYTVTSKKAGFEGNSIFLPSALCRYEGELHSGSNGNYWSSSLNSDYIRSAWYVNFYSGRYSGYVGRYSCVRCYGLFVRAVLPKE